jgi:hypothetical protein
MLLKNFDVVPRTSAGEFELSAVRIKRAATTLLGRRDDLVARAIEQPDTRRIRFAEQNAHHATTDETGAWRIVRHFTLPRPHQGRGLG